MAKSKSNKRKHTPPPPTKHEENDDNSDNSCPSNSDHAKSLCRQARSLWLHANSQNEMDQVEELLRSALNMKQQQKKKKKKIKNISSVVLTVAALSKQEYRRAGERLSLLYLQSQRPGRAKPGLQYLGYQCRLASHVLDYPTKSKSPSKISRQNNKKKKIVDPPCIILDEFLSRREVLHLRSVFASPTANYWTCHNYSVEPPSPYFSYVAKIPPTSKTAEISSSSSSFLYKLIDKIWNCHHLRTKFPQLRDARYVEMWAHNRPHASGHQLHFDSDNEGKGGQIRNPIISTILYLTTDEDDHDHDDDEDEANSRCGGPSLITNQRLQSTSLASKGWLAHSRPRRLVAFDGGVLHGVIPGKGYIKSKYKPPGGDDDDNKSDKNKQRRQPRRVTLMLAFWKDIKIRPSSQPGAARPWPTVNKKSRSQNDTESSQVSHPASWSTELMRRDVPVEVSTTNSGTKLTSPIALSHVYEDLDGIPWWSSSSSAENKMPEYDQVFQGF